jgi:hypothetical protein
MLAMPMFSWQRAMRLLFLVHSMSIPLPKLLAEMDLLDQSVAILRAAGVIDERTMRDTAASIRNFEYSVAEVLIRRGVINKEMTRKAVVLIAEIEKGVVSYEKALALLAQFRPCGPSEFEFRAASLQSTGKSCEWDTVAKPALVVAAA